MLIRCEACHDFKQKERGTCPWCGTFNLVDTEEQVQDAQSGLEELLQAYARSQQRSTHAS